jgi:hypothetical protein
VRETLGWSAGPGDADGAFLLLSDIHFDPFTDPSLVPALAAAPEEDWDSIFARSGLKAFPGTTDDDNWPLWRSALGALALPQVHYEYAIITGDILAHKFDRKFAAFRLGGPDAYEAFVRKTLLYVNHSLARALPNTPLYWTLGNNDSDCGDYGIVPNGKLLADLAKDWTQVARDPAAAADFVQDGYYETVLPGAAGRFIGLDTVAWSRHLNTACADPRQDPGKAELDWLGRHLQTDAQAGTMVTLAMHIPPGLNAFQNQCGLPSEAFFKPEDQGPFLDLLARYAPHIRLLFAGHTHFDDLKVYRIQGKPMAAVHLTPSIGPNHGNNPSFQVGLYRRSDGSLLDLATYTLRNMDRAAHGGPDGEWTLEYGFKLAYGQAFDTGGLDAVAAAIHARGAARALYEAFYAGETHSKAALDPSQWLPYSCAQTCFTPEEFEACACGAAAKAGR